MRVRSRFIALVAAGALLLGCTSGDDDTASTDTTAGAETETTEAAATGPAPGVTDTTIKIGVTYVDLASLEVASLNHGDYAAAFEAVIDDINAQGGIHGRTLEAVIVPIPPTSTDAPEAACVTLTEDEDVFMIVGFLQDDDVLCPLETHQTAVVGGSMSPERLARAEAPWYTYEAGTDLASDVVRTMAEDGELDGTVAVFAGAPQTAQVNDLILPLLEELGVDVVDVALAAEQTGEVDLAAAQAETAIIAERFEAAGVDQVIVVGAAGLGWATGVQPLDYRPELRLTDPASIQAYVTDAAGNDLSVLDGAIAGNLYGPAQAIWELPQMQECIAMVEAAGVPVPEPASIEPGTGSRYVAGTTACIAMTLVQALLDAAGEELNYGSLEAAVNDLRVQLPNSPEEAIYGPPPSADGDAAAFLFDWNPSTETFEIREG